MHTTPKSPRKDYPVQPAAGVAGIAPNTSAWWIREMVGRRKDVLDVGCATGYLARAIADNDCTICGLEVDAAAAGEARKYCTRVFEADLDFVNLHDAVQGLSFDVIVFGDVLEHIRQPARLLGEARALLRAGGYVVVSIRNIAHGATRLSLLEGNFNYSETGLLDETQLRFFTLKTVDELFLEAGYEVHRIERTKLGPFEESPLIPKVAQEHFSKEVIAQIETDPEFDTLQFVAQAFPLSDDAHLKVLTKRFTQANTELAAARKHSERREEQLLAIQSELARATGEAQAERQRREAAMEQAPDVELLAAKLADANYRAQNATDALHQKEIELARTQERATAEIARLNASVADLQERVKERQANVELLQGDIQRMRNERFEQRDALAAERSNLAKQGLKLEKLEAEAVELRGALDVANGDLARTRAELKDAVEVKEAATRDLDDLRGRFLRQTDSFLDRTRLETQHLSTLIGVVQTSKFWTLKRVLARLLGR